jgi:choline dehydrogenase-like flavoprotein
MNFSGLVYPSRANLDSWAAIGNEGWSAKDMAPYFRKFHKYVEPSAATKKLLSLDSYMDAANQGIGGPLPATIPDVWGDFNSAWNATFEKLGWQSTEDPILGGRLGAFSPVLSVDCKTGARGYATAYYTPEVAKRPNLTLLTETLVERVLFNTLKASNGAAIATGVRIRMKDGRVDQIMARREVILSAGALQTPQLLELSGIGNKDILNRYGIPVVVDSPVGENLQDHALSCISFEVADGQISGDVIRDVKVLEDLIQLYQVTRGGPLLGTPASMAFLPLVDSTGRLGEDEIQKLLEEYLDKSDKPLPPAGTKQYEILRRMLFKPDVASTQFVFLPLQMHTKPGKSTMAEVFAKELPGNYITIMVLNNHPLSRGSVHIQSADINVHPRYDPNFLSHPLDLEVLTRATQYLERIVQTEPFASLLMSPSSRIPADTDLSDPEATRQLVKDRLLSCFHPACSCPMMPREVGGVVNNRLVVYGTQNLRVVDASIFPLEPTGNIQATIYAVAEKAADIIKAESKPSWFSRLRRMFARFLC